MKAPLVQSLRNVGYVAPHNTIDRVPSMFNLKRYVFSLLI